MLIRSILTRKFSSNSLRITGNVGFIGIGNMGSRMAMNLLRSLKDSRKLYIYDKNQSTDSFKQLIAAGAIATSDPGHIVDDCSVLISMVPASAHVKDLYLNSIIPYLRKPTLLIDCSTIDPGTARAVQAAATAAGHTMLDAPVSGGIKGAEAGTLTFMVGTSLPEDAFSTQVGPVFAPMGTATYCGGPGVGQSVKICNNLILGAQMLSVSEGYRLAKSLGVNLETFNKIVNTSTGQCWASSKYNPVPGLMEGVPASRDYQGGFATDLMVKDLGLAVEAAKAEHCALPLTEFAKSQYAAICAGGRGALDFGVCY